MKVRTRFAPSPTGFLHIGGVRTALFNYLFAKKHDGTFILRLEDTDRERFVAKGVEQIVEALDWLGLKPDEGFWISQGKQQGHEYIQSERLKTGSYQKYVDQLIEKKLAYYSYITPEKYNEYKNKQRLAPFIYSRQLEAEYHDGTLKLKPNPNQKYPIRLDIAAVKQQLPELHSNGLAWHDENRGEFVEDLSLMEDFILIKSDGYPTYNFANVIDDHEMDISHAIRGDEFIASTGKHALLYEIFGWDKPKFVHLPVINGTDGKKLSKRSGDTNTLDYRDKGYLPEALLNFLALLGWNDGTEQEIFGLDELIKKFSLERVNNSSAVFDGKRLDWMNGHYIRETPLPKLYKRVESFWPQEAAKYDDTYKQAVLGLVQERLKYLAEVPELTLFFFKDLPVDHLLIANHKQLGSMPKEQLKILLEKSQDTLEQSDFSVDDLTKRLNLLREETDQKPVVLFSLIRIATTQAPSSPGLAETLAVLGKDTSLKRIKQQLSVI